MTTELMPGRSMPSSAAVERDPIQRRTRRRRFGRVPVCSLAVASAVFAAPAVAQGEPSGGAFEFARESVFAPGIVSAENGRALTFWSSGGGGAARVLGRTGPLTSRVPLNAPNNGSGVIAANPSTGRYLRVWVESTATCCSSSRTFRIYSQLLDRAGAAVAARSLLITQQNDGAFGPTAVAWNPRNRQYLVTYSVEDEGYEEFGSLVLGEDATTVIRRTALPVSPDQPRTWTAVAARPKDGTYLLAWTNLGIVYAQVLDAAGKVSGPAIEVSRHSNLRGLVENQEPSIAVDPVSNEAIVVWSDRYEVFARRITASGTVTGSDLWLSRMGPRSDPDWLTRSPDIAYSSAAGQYLVVWQSGPGDDPYPAGEKVYGQHLSRTGGQIGTNDFAISTLDRAVEPAVTGFARATDFLVAWSSQRKSPSGWARRVTRTP